MRARVLREDPICTCPGCDACSTTGCFRLSTDDDHIVPVAEGGTDDRANHRGMCHPCHEVKAEQERLRGIGRRLGARKGSQRHPGLL